jgi:hypothetical protein
VLTIVTSPDNRVPQRPLGRQRPVEFSSGSNNQNQNSPRLAAYPCRKPREEKRLEFEKNHLFRTFPNSIRTRGPQAEEVAKDCIAYVAKHAGT